MLENEFTVGGTYPIRVLGLGRDIGDLIRQDTAGGIAHGNLLHEGMRQGAIYLGPGHGDGLGRTRQGEIVRDGDDEFFRGADAQREQGGERQRGEEVAWRHGWGGKNDRKQTERDQRASQPPSTARMWPCT